MSEPIDPAILDAVDAALIALPVGMNTQAARVALLAIGLQESRFEHRRQLVGKPALPVGPAKGFWQFERGGGCIGVVTHRSSAPHVIAACGRHGIEPTSRAIWDAIEHNDVLAATMARLLLYTDPRKLPALGDAQGLWDYYIDTWRPGKPHRKTWLDCYAQAVREESMRWGQ